VGTPVARYPRTHNCALRLLVLRAPLAAGKVQILAGLGHRHSIHRVSGDHTATVWDNAAEPILEVESGSTVQLETIDASAGQLTRNSTALDVAKMDRTNVNPITGPVFVKGAGPGDVLAVEILELTPHEWGWTAIIPGFGLLADEFPAPWLNVSLIDAEAGTVQFADGVVLPFAPFPGTIGVAPRDHGQHSIRPPRMWGGNMDIKHLTPGSTLLLPVGVEGALFSVGDGHAAMGDAEVCGTAVETAMDIVVRLTVHRDRTIPYPQYRLPKGALSLSDKGAYHVCTGIHSDLLEAAREATRGVIAHIQEHHGRSREEAYAIASVAVDLRIHEVVDAPNWVVGAFLPESIFVA
jgi:acetamidase/formamidase